MARGTEKIETKSLRPVTSVSTVPGDGCVMEDSKARMAGKGNSAAEFTKPASEKMGG